VRGVNGGGAGTGADGGLDPASLAGLTELGLGPQPLPHLEAMVAVQLRRPRAHVLTARLRAHPYDRPALTTAGRYLVSGTAADDAGQTRTYAFFVKLVQAWTRSPLSAEVPEPLRSQLAAALPALVDELESLRTTTAHGDACVDNLLRTRLDEDIVLIDFGFWGAAPVGFDLGQLILGEIQLGRRPAGTFPELEEACLPAYVQGLREEGCATPLHEVRRAHAIVATIFHAIPSIPYEHRTARTTAELRPLFANRAAMARCVLDLLDATEEAPRRNAR
jgi:hypothetical protein